MVWPTAMVDVVCSGMFSVFMSWYSDVLLVMALLKLAFTLNELLRAIKVVVDIFCVLLDVTIPLVRIESNLVEKLFFAAPFVTL